MSPELALSLVSLLGVVVALYRQRAAKADERVDDLLSCKERCAILGEELAVLRERVAALEGVEAERDKLRIRVAALEDEVRRLRALGPLRRTLPTSIAERKAT